LPEDIVNAHSLTHTHTHTHCLGVVGYEGPCGLITTQHSKLP